MSFDNIDLSLHDELETLCQMLNLGQGEFSMSVAVCNSPGLRDSLITAISERVSSVEVVAIPPQTIDVYGFVTEHAKSRENALFIVSLEASVSCTSADQHALRSLNASRDLWPTAFKCPVVFWLPEYAATALSETAQDFWRIRSHRFYFSIAKQFPVLRQPDTIEGRFVNATLLSLEEKKARITELESRLSKTDAATPGSLSMQLSWWDELAALHEFIGNWDQALRVFREQQLPACERLGNLKAKATTLGRIGELLMKRCQWEDALRIHRDEQLPLSQQLGDEHGVAFAWGGIADVLQQRGELNESLRIRREEELPRYDRLGDERAVAMTWARIADVLQSQGKVDEALLLRRERVLPIVERMGDLHGKAITLGRIADALFAKGAVREAVRIWKEEELPICEQLGDLRSKALTLCSLSDADAEEGRLAEAIRRYREEVLPIAEQLGDVRFLVQAQRDLGVLFYRRHEGADLRRAKEQLSSALADAERLKLPEASGIRRFIRQAGLQS